MGLLYRVGMTIFSALLWVIALFVPKASRLVKGRTDSIKRLKKLTHSKTTSSKNVWFHFASLGEFEQGRPILEYYRNKKPEYSCFITFYSPSGYEICRNTPLADDVFYLPSDSPGNARLLLDALSPDLVIFTKYEYWNFYFKECAERNVPLYIISAIFRPGQIYFKFYGRFFRAILLNVRHFFAQNDESLRLLAGIGLQNATLAGDTRFDRVLNLPEVSRQTPLVDSFVGENDCIVAGSTWIEDDTFLAITLASLPKWKCVLAPHEIHEDRISQIQNLFPGSLRFSDVEKLEEPIRQSVLAEAQVLIIDSIGMLSTLYAYGSVAYIGGGFGAGIHNTLEAATHGIPVIFGPNFRKFQEARDLLALQSASSFASPEELLQWILKMENVAFRQAAGSKARRYVESSAGATPLILSKLKNH